jgi:hypothetical protein
MGEGNEACLMTDLFCVKFYDFDNYRESTLRGRFGRRPASKFFERKGYSNTRSLIGGDFIGICHIICWW